MLWYWWVRSSRKCPDANNSEATLWSLASCCWTQLSHWLWTPSKRRGPGNSQAWSEGSHHLQSALCGCEQIREQGVSSRPESTIWRRHLTALRATSLGWDQECWEDRVYIEIIEKRECFQISTCFEGLGWMIRPWHQGFDVFVSAIQNCALVFNAVHLGTCSEPVFHQYDFNMHPFYPHVIPCANAML